VEAAIRTEEDVVLPTARLLLDAQERKALTRALMSANETRPWLDAAFAGDAPVLHKIYAVRTRRADGSDVVRSFARCPRQRAIDVGTCANCAHQEALVVHGDGRGHVACAIDDRRPPTHRRVADVMTRDVFCVEQDTPLQDAVEMLAGARVTGVPVVDGEGRAVGVLSQSDVISAMAAGALTPGARVRDLMMHMAIVARENDPLDDAARLLVLEGIHRLPVINAEGFVVGIVSALDVLRGSSAIAQRPVLDRTSTPSG
jgi:CBS domain-containing protein